MKPERKFAASSQQDQREYAEPEEDRVVESEPSFRLPDWLPVDFMDRSPEERLKLLEAKAEKSVEKSQEVYESTQEYLDEAEEEAFYENTRQMANMKPLVGDVRRPKKEFGTFHKAFMEHQRIQNAYHQEYLDFQEQGIVFPDTQYAASYREAPAVLRLPSRQTLDQELKVESDLNARLRVELMDRVKELDQLKKRLAQESRWKKWAKIGMLALGALSGAAYGQRSLEREDAQGVRTSYERANAQNVTLETELRDARNHLFEAEMSRATLVVRAAMRPDAVSEGIGGFFGNGNVNRNQIDMALLFMDEADLHRLSRLTRDEIQSVRDDLARVNRGGLMEGRYVIDGRGLSSRRSSQEIQSALKGYLVEMERLLESVEGLLADFSTRNVPGRV